MYVPPFTDILSTEINGHSAPSSTAPVPWNDRPMVEKKLERRVREKERSDEAAARDTGNNRAPPGIGNDYNVYFIYTYVHT